MAEDNRSLNSAEANNDTSWYKAFGAGLASGIIKIPEGLSGHRLEATVHLVTIARNIEIDL